MMKLGFVQKCSFMGIAAGLVDGSTIMKTFQITTGPRELSPDNLLELRKKIKFHKLVLLIVDECSMITPTHIHVVDMRLRQLAGLPNTPFGGIAIILTGDYMQTQPVKATSIPFAVMDAVEIARLGEPAEETGKKRKRSSKLRSAVASSENKDFVTQAYRQGALQIIQFKCIAGA
jgi:hypothetical protein